MTEPKRKRDIPSIRKLYYAAIASAMCGAIAPDILIVYSKRWGDAPVELPHWQYFAAMLMYILIAAVIGLVYPYKPRPSAWKGFVVGVSTPTILSALASIARPIPLAPRGFNIPATFWDIISLW